MAPITDQEFREQVTAHMAVANQRWESIAGMVSEIRHGTMCPVGIRATNDIETLKRADGEQWKAIDKLRDLAKHSGIIIAGCGVITAGVIWYRAIWGEA